MQYLNFLNERGVILMIEKTVAGLHAHLFNLFESIVGNAKKKSILDIGCGSGAWLDRVKILGFNRMVGIDYIQPKAVSGLELMRFDINHDAPNSLGQFDVISCIEVIEHIENIGNLLDLIKDALNKDGLACVTTPNIESLRARVRAVVSGRIPSFDSKSDPTHLCPVLRDSLQKMLSRRNLAIAEVHQYPLEKSKSLMFGAPVSIASSLLRPLFPDDLYGDNTIYIVKHA